MNAVVAPEFTVWGTEGLMLPPDPADGVTVNGTASTVKVAETEQFAVIGPVVKVFPDNAPPQPLAEATWYPTSGMSENEMIAPAFTVCGAPGLMLPPDPADGVTVNGTVSAAKVAETAQFAVIAPVV